VSTSLHESRRCRLTKAMQRTAHTSFLYSHQQRTDCCVTRNILRSTLWNPAAR
jgi:hypothetical protein